jgi:hypothetical protein
MVGRVAKILLAQLPKSFRRLAFDQVPAEVRRELSALGIGGGDFCVNRRSRRAARGSRWKDWMTIAFGLGFLLCVIVGAGVGFRTIVKWVAHAFR